MAFPHLRPGEQVEGVNGVVLGRDKGMAGDDQRRRVDRGVHPDCPSDFWRVESGLGGPGPRPPDVVVVLGLRVLLGSHPRPATPWA